MCFLKSKADSTITKLLLLLIISILYFQKVEAQNTAGFIYGKVETQSNTYEGPIRWGKEEVYWQDYFNASKRENPYRNDCCGQTNDNSSWLDFNWDLQSIWEDRNTVHQFNCQFGDLKQLKVKGSNTRLQFKNGWEINVVGPGYNDLEDDIQIIDKELGLLTLNWNNVNKVDFMQGPKKNAQKFGEPIFGIVETYRKERYSGFILWDHDERISTDKIDGSTKDGKVSISFSEITKIEKNGSGCQVTLKSGRELYVFGSNDVNPENRGITVLVQGVGMVDVPWSSFKKLNLTPKDESGPGYDAFAVPKNLSGKVFQFEGKELEGKLVYDFDETLDLETLEGTDNGIHYTIPFRNIKSIQPKNNVFSLVELKNGERLLLEGGNDVSEGNGGVLVFLKGAKNPVHVKRRKIDQIIFD